MIKPKDCAGCAHEKVCEQKNRYERARRDVRETICSYPEDLCIVSVRCGFFAPKQQEKAGESCGAQRGTACNSEDAAELRAKIARQEEIIEFMRDICIGCLQNVTKANKETITLLAQKNAMQKFADRLCEGRVSNDPVVIAVKAELKIEEAMEILTENQ